MPTFGEGLGLGASSFLTGFLNAKAEQNRMRRVAEEERRAEMEREERREKVQRALQGEQFARERAATMEDIRSRIRTPEEQTFAEIGERPMAPPPQFSPMAQAAGLKQREFVPDTMGEREADRIRMERAAAAMAQAREQRMGGLEERGAIARTGKLESEAPGGEMYGLDLQGARGEFVGPKGALERQGMIAQIGQRNRANTDEDGGGPRRLPGADEKGFVVEMMMRGHVKPDARDYMPMLDEFGDPVRDKAGNVVPDTSKLNYQRMFEEIAAHPNGPALWEEYRRTGTLRQAQKAPAPVNPFMQTMPSILRR